MTIRKTFKRSTAPLALGLGLGLAVGATAAIAQTQPATQPANAPSNALCLAILITDENLDSAERDVLDAAKVYYIGRVAQQYPSPEEMAKRTLAANAEIVNKVLDSFTTQPKMSVFDAAIKKAFLPYAISCTNNFKETFSKFSVALDNELKRMEAAEKTSNLK